MADIKSEFFSLLRAGLWKTRPDESLFNKETDWKEIYRRSKLQALSGIIFDGIELLPPAKRPDRSLYLKWCAEVLQIEDINKKFDREVVSLFNLLRRHGIKPVLMKGQGVARNYPCPSRRVCGDIDIYIGKKNYDKTNILLSLDGEPLKKWASKHQIFFWHDVVVENHKFFANLMSPKAEKNFYRLIDEWHLSNERGEVKINDIMIDTPPLNFDAVYLLLHSIIHLMGFGVGLRQICDWVIFLHNKHSELSPEIVHNYLIKLGISKSWNVFGALAVKYLGLSREELLFPYSAKDEKLADILLEDIWNNGNLGLSKGKEKDFINNSLISSFITYIRGLKRARKFYYLAPGEALWLPFWRARNFLRHKKWLLTH